MESADFRDIGRGQGADDNIVLGCNGHRKLPEITPGRPETPSLMNLVKMYIMRRIYEMFCRRPYPESR